MAEPTKEYRARIWVKLTDDILPSPALSKTELEARLSEALAAGAPNSLITSVSVSDPSDSRPRRR